MLLQLITWMVCIYSLWNFVQNFIMINNCTELILHKPIFRPTNKRLRRLVKCDSGLTIPQSLFTALVADHLSHFAFDCYHWKYNTYDATFFLKFLFWFFLYTYVFLLIIFVSLSTYTNLNLNSLWLYRHQAGLCNSLELQGSTNFSRVQHSHPMKLLTTKWSSVYFCITITTSSSDSKSIIGHLYPVIF